MNRRANGAVSPRVEIRMDPGLKQEVEEAAALLGTTFTAFAIQALVERARRVKQEQKITYLSDEARDAFIQLILDPPAPSEALKRTLNTTRVQI